ncbi:MAG: hypothetical protein ACUVTD_01900 [Nitrososphaerales archaeon]
MFSEIKDEVKKIQKEYKIIGRDIELESALTAVSAGKMSSLKGW